MIILKLILSLNKSPLLMMELAAVMLNRVSWATAGLLGNKIILKFSSLALVAKEDKYLIGEDLSKLD
jgi:hypothetical protein